MSSGPQWSSRRDGSQYRRLCARPGCGSLATVTLRFESTERQAWLVELDHTASRTQGDLCQRHAAALVLPRGWELHDERVVADSAEADRDEPADQPVETTVETTVETAVETGEEVGDGEAEAEADGAGGHGSLGPFGSNDDDEEVEEALDAILDARTPLLQRAFRNARPL